MVKASRNRDAKSNNSKDRRVNRDFKESRNTKDNRGTKPNRFENTRVQKIAPIDDAAQKPMREDLIEGRNAVIEALKSDRTIEQIFVAKGDVEGSINVVLGLAKDNGIVVKEVDRKKLDQMSETGSHQGVIAIVTPYKYFSVENILDYAESKGEKPFIIILDEIEDPHNFGSIIRTAEVCGAHGIIIPKRRNVGVTPTVYKSSAGAVEHMRIAKVTNLNNTIDGLKEKGVWIYGADMEGENYCFDVNFDGAAAIVVGSEGRGISRLTKEKCDVLIKIPMVGNITSLNASVAGGIMMYEILKQRIKRG
ncbi:23S rRNA (guanosine(2251)-2'-O)-methyltransferase RlmB [Clostridium omnivorum]|uniref:23S rRNA (Guanosine(2251)-2'-O)-methyltransferase RlmB n=2 Tax=Clostridium omnivorum TaxID=1604902 RepID=A0ABQ5N3S6_9CLOT|nr:23S rRNA (guanosine(2251)-2'-O)-methyltransferase RlmB [Clostridium sp. E14]